MTDGGTPGEKELALLLYLIERAVSHGNADFDIEEAWDAYAAALRQETKE